MPLASQHVGIELCKLWGIPHDRVLEIDINVGAVGYIHSQHQDGRRRPGAAHQTAHAQRNRRGSMMDQQSYTWAYTLGQQMGLRGNPFIARTEWWAAYIEGHMNMPPQNIR